MNVYGRKWQRAGFLCLAAVMLTGCGSQEKNPEPMAAAEGAMGSYEQVLTCTMGRRTLANPKFPEGDTYENNAYTRYVMEKLNVQMADGYTIGKALNTMQDMSQPARRQAIKYLDMVKAYEEMPGKDRSISRQRQQIESQGQIIIQQAEEIEHLKELLEEQLEKQIERL